MVAVRAASMAPMPIFLVRRALPDDDELLGVALARSTRDAGMIADWLTTSKVGPQ